MKKLVLIILGTVFGFTVSMAAGEIENTANITATSICNSPVVCQFSLTSYSGTINGGYTNAVQVGLSCPQGGDVRATVFVYIDGEQVASTVVTVSAGQVYSASTNIWVGHDYNGKSYKLQVM